MGRANHIDGLFIKLAQRDIRGHAYRALTPRAQAAINDLCLFYWEGSRENPIVLTQRWLAHRLSINPKTAGKVIDDLESHWFLNLERFGKLTGPLGERGALYRLTWLPTSDGHPAGHDSRGWLPEIPARDAVRIGPSTRRRKVVNAGQDASGRGHNRSVLTPGVALLNVTKNLGGAAPTASFAIRLSADELATRNSNSLPLFGEPVVLRFSIQHASDPIGISRFHPTVGRQISHMISR
jgi:hypothetical protein